jgi:hypothetical protein
VRERRTARTHDVGAGTGEINANEKKENEVKENEITG